MSKEEHMNATDERLDGEPVFTEEDLEAQEEAKKRKEEKERERRRALSDYQKYLEEVMRTKEMTDTESWRMFWTRLKSSRAKHNEDMLNEDQTRPMIRHQEAIKLIDDMSLMVKKPIDDLDRYCESMPLFVAEFKTRAVWNENLGTVTIRSIDD